MTKTKNISELLQLANHYPSPHNGQPIRVKILSDDQLELYFERERGLQATDISFLFSFVSMGVFAEHLQLSASALGHDLSYIPDLPSEADLRGSGPIAFAQCHITWDTKPADDQLRQTLTDRQTSRKKYYEGPSRDFAAHLTDTAQHHNMKLVELDKAQTKQAIWLNQRAVFDDMFDEAIRQELNHWLRYSPEEKNNKRDGLAYDCMELNGPVMRYIVNHPKILHLPGISWTLQQYYLRTMTDESSVFYMLAPFKTEADSFRAGEVVMKVWQQVATAGYYLHPFGTIMSNHEAHRDFVRLAGIDHESREQSYLVFIFRAGKSKKPIESLRIPYHQHLIMEQKNESI